MDPVATEGSRMACEDAFEAVWSRARGYRGWLTEGQARLLFSCALGAPQPARILEIGSYEGRSTVVLATAIAGTDGSVVAVDPFVDDWKYGSPTTRRSFEAHIAQAGVDGHVQLIADYSTAVRPGWSAPLDVLFIDGKHDVVTVLDDLRWARHVRTGGVVLVHDCFSSVGVTLGVLSLLRPGSRLRYADRSGSLARFEVGSVGLVDRGRLLAQLPWWLRNLALKLLLRARLGGVARRLGHDSPYDPY
ncbi:MAG: class I SAM-dependent methyltransferase [Tetrasphaera sp.]|jgi:hypothetical protein|nr:class I SAM-dependent methyltransferase [Tetrasphaera sp.]